MDHEEISRLAVAKSWHDIWSSGFFFGVLTLIAIGIAGKVLIISKIFFYIFAILFSLNSLNVLKSIILAVVCLFGLRRDNASFQARYLLADVFRITEHGVMFVWLSLLCDAVYGRSLINIILSYHK